MNPTGDADRATRRAQVVEALADAVGTVDRTPPIHVAVDGLIGSAANALADDLGGMLTTRSRRCRRASLDAVGLLDPRVPRPGRPAHRAGRGDDLMIVDGRFLQHPELMGAWDLVIFVRESAATRAAARYLAEIDPEGTANIVVDLSDPTWPVIRRIDPAIADRLGRDLHPGETRAFFAPRAATWDQRFPDDDPVYAAAVAEVGLRPGQTALDVGCGTGRALPHLRAAVGPSGHVLGVDLTPEMLATARIRGRHNHALLVLADARRLPLRTGSVDAGFAAGLLPHLPDPGRGLAELARVIRPSGRLALFHPSGRAALAARQGRRLHEDDLLAPAPLRRLLEQSGWRLDRHDDGPNRFLAIAERVSPRT